MVDDLKFALRLLRKSPGFAFAAIATLAMGFGANAAMFTVVNAVLLRSLEYRNADRIVTVETLWQNSGRTGQVSAPDFRDWKAQSTSFEAMAMYNGGELGVQFGDRAEHRFTYLVGPDFFRVMGTGPIVGRLFSTDEEKPNGPGAALVSDDLAHSHFGGTSAALGRTLRLENRQFTIVGVMPAGFHFPRKAQIWLPLATMPESPYRTGHNYRAVALLKPGVSVEQAQADMQTIGARLEAQYPADNKGKSIRARRLQDTITSPLKDTLWLLMGAVGLVLLLACANVANMLLARAAVRTREIAIRASVGAGRWRIVRQMIAESAVLALIAGGAGAVLAFWLTDALVALAPANVPRIEQVGLDGRVLLFLFGASAVATFAFGLVPALHASRVDLNEALRQGGGRGLLGGRSNRMRSVLVVAQIAVAFVLTTGAALLFRSFVALTEVDLGFKSEKLLVMYTSVPAKTREDHIRATGRLCDLIAEVRTIPGISEAAGVMGAPAGKYSSNGTYRIEGRPEPKAMLDGPQAWFRLATPGYFRTLGVPLVRGRDFDERDTADATPVAVVTEALVRQQFPNEDPIGKRMRNGFSDLDKWITIVGVVGDLRTNDPSRAPEPEIFMSYHQHPFAANELQLVMRTSGDPTAVASTVREKVRLADASIAVTFTTMDAMLHDALASPRFRTTLMMVFAGLAIALAIAGVYGVIAYVVTQRISEFGLRLALGAEGSDVLRLVMRHGFALAAVGVLIGVPLSWAANRAMATMLFGVKPTDPMTWMAAVAAVAAVTVAATAVPAWRAARVDPVEALRAE